MNGQLKNENNRDNFLVATKWIRIAIVVVLSELYLLFFCVTTSPLYDVWGGDSAFYILVGKGIKYGYLPYRDIFDGKGPYLYLLEYIGQLICEGRFGAFIIQSCLFCTSMIFFDKTIGVGRKQRSILETILLIPLLLMAVFSIGGGGLTEDFSLLPISVCLYLCVKYINGNEKKHSPLYAGIYGLLFGILAFLRINNSAIICACVLTICVILITGREYKNLFYNAVAFIVGCFLAVMPIIIFFASKHILTDMLDQVFLYGLKYSALVKSNGIISIVKGEYRTSILPLGVGLVASLVFLKKDTWKSAMLIWISTIASILAVAVSGRNFDHYYVLFIPVVALNIWYLWNRIANYQAKDHHTLVVFIGIFIISFLGIIKLDYDYFKQNVTNEKDTTVDDSIRDASSNIGEGSVYCWTPNPRWYSVADRFPSFRHCYWQNDQMETDPNIGVELSEMFLNDPPDWLVLEINSSVPEFVIQSAESYFEITYINDYWIVLKNKSS